MVEQQSIKSGQITREMRAWVRENVQPGDGYLPTCESIEREIVARGGSPAFPTGIGVNDVTAHYSPQGGDQSTFNEKDLIKIDFGVHIEGYLTDTSVTLTFNPDHEAIIEATERALKAAIETLKKDKRTGEIGRVVYHEASKYGFRTIENLTGHTVDRYVVHAGRSVPNVYTPGAQQLRTGDVVAIEPFLTPKSAAGYVVDSPVETIFSVLLRKNTGDRELDAFLAKVWDERKTLPFTPRWYADEYGEAKLGSILKQLVKKRIVRSYPTLVEASGNPVAQFEHTVALETDGIVVLT